MGDGEHAAVQPVQPAGAGAMGDRTTAEAGVGRLTPAHHAVLGRGEAGDDDVGPGPVELFIHHMTKSPSARSSPPCPGCGSIWSCLT